MAVSALLVAFTRAAQLSGAEVTRYIDAGSRGPIMVYFWLPWSEPCRSLDRIWQDFASGLDPATGVSAGNVSCSDEPALCERLKLDSYPAIYWHDATRSSCVSYEGPLHLSEMQHFLRSRTSFPFWPVKSESEIRAISANARISPLFIFCITEDMDLDIPRAILELHRDLDFTAAVIRRPERTVMAIKDFDWQVNYPQGWKWDQVSLRRFIETNLIPTTVTLTSAWFDMSVRSGKLVCIVYGPLDAAPYKMRIMHNRVIFLRGARIPKFDRAFGIGPSDEVFVLYNPKMRRFGKMPARTDEDLVALVDGQVWRDGGTADWEWVDWQRKPPGATPPAETDRQGAAFPYSSPWDLVTSLGLALLTGVLLGWLGTMWW